MAFRVCRAATVLAGMLATAEALAQGSMSSHGHTPLEQRVVVAVGPERTTSWAQLRARTEPGTLAIVVPASPGAALDWASPAWTEALEEATAPRILPPPGTSGSCPGAGAPEDATHVIGVLQHEPVLAPVEVLALADAATVASWAAQHGIAVPAVLEQAMTDLGSVRFVVARFETAGGEVLTPTVRVVAPAIEATLPLSLATASDAVLGVTVWTLAPGSAALDGPPAALDEDDLVYDAVTGETNYEAVRGGALATLGPRGWLTETSSRTAMVQTIELEATTHTIEPVVDTYFAAGALYDLGAFDGKACAAAAGAALAQSVPVAASCARAELGYVEGGSCVEAPAPRELDPSVLRCGTADDLAVALSGLQPTTLRLTRAALRVTPGAGGERAAVTVGPAASIDPVIEAGDLDTADCPLEPEPVPPDDGSRSESVPVYRRDRGCSGDAAGAPVSWTTVEVEAGEEAPDAYYQDTDCSGNTTGSYTTYDQGSSSVDVPDTADTGSSASDDCDSYDGSSSGDDCSSDTTGSSGDDCSSESGSSGDDCSSDSGSSGDDCDSYDGSSGADDCDSGGSSGSDGCDSGGSSGGDGCGGSTSSGDCAVSGGRRVRPRFSVLCMGAFGLLAPLRRLFRARASRRTCRTRSRPR
jgi:hypothetical protein